MLKPLLVIAIAVSSHASAAEVGRDVYYSGYLAPENIVPTFDHGYVSVHAASNKLIVFGPDGLQRYEAAVQGDPTLRF